MANKQGYYRFGASRSHSGCEIIEQKGPYYVVRDHCETYNTEKPVREVTVLPEGQIFCGILWAGGWDDYILSLADVREQTDEELASGQRSVDAGSGLPPTFRNDEGSWLRGYFAKKHGIEANQCIKIVRHLGGGD